MTSETERWLRWIEGERRLSPSARRVGQYLAGLAPIGGAVEDLTIAEIGQGAGVSYGSARMALRQLRACGMVAIKAGGGRGWRNRFTLKP